MIWKYGETYKSKSGADLKIVIQLTKNQLKEFFKNNVGFRIYRLDNIQKGREGAKEFHKIRKEIFIIERGKIELKLEDLKGLKSKYELKENYIFYFIPPFTYHLYRGLTDNSSMAILANTLYFKDKPETYDTYSENEFKELQRANK
jgi:mannose-6-phosphate isomerase-like protein (cupin superfamily)